MFEIEFSLDQWRNDQTRIHRHVEFQSDAATTLLVLTWRWRSQSFPSPDASESLRVWLVRNTSHATKTNDACATNDAASVLEVIRADITSSSPDSTYAWHFLLNIATSASSSAALLLLVVRKSEIKGILRVSISVVFILLLLKREVSLSWSNTPGKKQQQFVCVYFSLLGQHLLSFSLSSNFFVFSPWIKRHCIIDTAWFVAWLVLVCRWLLDYVAYTHQMRFERCRSFFRPRREKKERLVTRNHLTTRAREREKFPSIDRSVYTCLVEKIYSS